MLIDPNQMPGGRPKLTQDQKLDAKRRIRERHQMYDRRRQEFKRQDRERKKLLVISSQRNVNEPQFVPKSFKALVNAINHFPGMISTLTCTSDNAGRQLFTIQSLEDSQSVSLRINRGKQVMLATELNRFQWLDIFGDLWSFIFLDEDDYNEFCDHVQKVHCILENKTMMGSDECKGIHEAKNMGIQDPTHSLVKTLPAAFDETSGRSNRKKRKALI